MSAGSELDREILAIQNAVQTGDLNTASRLLDASLKQHPNEGGLLNLRGILHARRDEMSAARSDFEQAVRFSPGLTPAWQNLARACQEQSRQEESAAECAVRSWREVLHSDPQNSEAQRSLIASMENLAVDYEKSGRAQDARNTLEALAGLDTKNTAHLLELARLADQQKDYEGALGYLAHARDLDPDTAQIHYLFAMIATKMDLPVEARASLNKALALEPDNPDYNYAMGFVILSTRDAATASTYFQKFVKARPASIKGQYALGIAYFASGDYVRSRAQMEKVAGDASTAGGAEYFLGRIARRENDPDASIQHLQQSIKLMPEFAESHTELARVYMMEGKLPEARTELEKAIALDPQSFQANEQLLVLYKRTRAPEADKQAELVKRLDEDRSKRAELMVRTIEARP